MTYDGQPPSDAEKYFGNDIEYIKKRWDNRADRWDDDLSDKFCHLNRNNSYQMFIDILTQEIDKDAKFHNSSGFLDLGCGTGELLRLFSNNFLWSCGIDISAKMLECARNKLNDNILLLEGSVFDASIYPNKNISVIASRGVLLSHYGDKMAEDLMCICYKLLAQNGFIFFDAINSKSADLPSNKRCYSGCELIELAVKAGFSSAVTIGDEKYPLLYLKAVKH